MRMSDHNGHSLPWRSVVLIAAQALAGFLVASVPILMVSVIGSTACWTGHQGPTAGFFLIISLMLLLAGVRFRGFRIGFLAAALAFVIFSASVWAVGLAPEDCAL